MSPVKWPVSPHGDREMPNDEPLGHGSDRHQLILWREIVAGFDQLLAFVQAGLISSRRLRGVKGPVGSGQHGGNGFIGLNFCHTCTDSDAQTSSVEHQRRFRAVGR